ncbi:transcription repressor OFP6-like protein [Cinnamomum micranthum f. kanehirae]|uniref:Transcription repressor n=1 Tax=Cinnamomum micranthum f. kanehirae TaxID=337451 RepID=A0A3S3Q6J2_9MAGN|nr:transcription repressor OFP6-like protein [Cinnamomum micranthum f. kanehirae]
MSSARRKLPPKPPIVNVGCGCRRPKLSNMFSPRPKSKFSNYHEPHVTHSSSSSGEGCGLSFNGDGNSSSANSTATLSPMSHLSQPPCAHLNDPIISFRKQIPCGCGGTTLMGIANTIISSSRSWRICQSVAVVKDSDDPYLDFQHSMLQMIIEKEIYSKDDLWELLNCFLSLNSPYHHQIIIRAFMEIWTEVFAAEPKSPDFQGLARANVS